MSKHFFYRVAALLSMGALAEGVVAHVGVGSVPGFTAGFMHPFTGLDHLLTMVAVGLWSSTLGGRALWLVPLSFVATMALGAGIQAIGLVLPSAEVAVALSVAGLGLILLVNWRASYGLAGALAAGFALFHGYVHAEKIGQDMSTLYYAGGFLLATLALHGLGILLGVSVGHMNLLRQAFGAFCAGAGFYLLVGS